MTRLDRGLMLRVAGAVACLTAGAILVLLATDASGWSKRMPADDLRYRANPAASDLWQPRALAPFRLAATALGVADDTAYRRALREFRLGRPLELIFSTEISTYRAQAQVDLARVRSQGGDPLRRSQAANLLGVLGFAMATQDRTQAKTFLNNAITSFRDAIELDPRNEDALFNLEYALDQQKGDDPEQAGGRDRLGNHGNAGLKDPGRGY